MPLFKTLDAGCVASFDRRPCSPLRGTVSYETFSCVCHGGTGEESSSASFLKRLPLGGVAKVLLLLLFSLLLLACARSVCTTVVRGALTL